MVSVSVGIEHRVDTGDSVLYALVPEVGACINEHSLSRAVVDDSRRTVAKVARVAGCAYRALTSR